MKKWAVKLNKKNILYKAAAICFWLIVWEIISRVVNEKLFIASPYEVVVTLFDLITKSSFWETIFNSVTRIMLGFAGGIILGIILAVLSYMSRLLYEIIAPIIKIIKATPVVSFIILALIWFTSKNLSVLISFLMVLPIIYSNVLQGIKATDSKLLEMAKVFRLRRLIKLRAIYLPAVRPYLISSISVGMGFCFKSGIAAEVIGIPTGSIGEKLYQAKLYFMTAQLFAWTVIIILISVLLEKLIMFLFSYYDRYDRG